MIEVKALKYYTIARYREVEGAHNRLTKLQEQHPDNEYAILVNMRAYQKQYIVSRVEEVEVEFPLIGDLYLPALPPKPAGNRWEAQWRQAWRDYDYEQRKRDEIIKKAHAPIKARLEGPFGA